MNLGILVLRVLLGSILVAHSFQKSRGWFGGQGLDRMATVFEGLGLRPGRAMVLTASTFELLAALSLVAGALTPLGAVTAVGTMGVAGLTMSHASGRLWNAAGGGEYPFVLAATAAVLGFTGAGAYSVDAVLRHAMPAVATLLEPHALTGVLVVVVGCLATVPFARVLWGGRATIDPEGDEAV